MVRVLLLFSLANEGDQPTRFQDASALPLARCAPNPVIDTVLERVFETPAGDRAINAKLLGPLDANAVRWKKGGWRMISAVSLQHPVVLLLVFVHGISLGVESVVLPPASRTTIVDVLHDL